MPASNTIVLKSLSILLGLFFIFVGTLKLTPHISKDLYKDLVSGKIDSVGTGALFTMRRAALSSIFSRSEREKPPHKPNHQYAQKQVHHVVVLHPSYITGS